jgi:hypothetical protein
MLQIAEEAGEVAIVALEVGYPTTSEAAIIHSYLSPGLWRLVPSSQKEGKGTKLQSLLFTIRASAACYPASEPLDLSP